MTQTYRNCGSSLVRVAPYYTGGGKTVLYDRACLAVPPQQEVKWDFSYTLPGVNYSTFTCADNVYTESYLLYSGQLARDLNDVPCNTTFTWSGEQLTQKYGNCATGVQYVMSAWRFANGNLYGAVASCMEVLGPDWGAWFVYYDTYQANYTTVFCAGYVP